MNKNKEKGRIRALLSKNKSYIFLLGWIYVFGKLFIADLEAFLFSTYNLGESWILKYRFIFLVLIAVLIWVRIGFLPFLKNLGLFLLYPFKLFLWRVPFFLFYYIPKQLISANHFILLYGYVESLIYFFRHLKYSALIFCLICIALLSIFNSQKAFMITPSIIILALYMVYHFYGRLKYAIKPLSMIVSNSEFLEKFDENAFIPRLELKTEDKKDPKILDKKKDEHIQNLINLKNLMKFLAIQIDNYSKMAFLILMSTKIVGTFTLCIFISSMINFGLYKMSNDNFKVNLGGITTFYDFIIYGFHTVVPDGTFVEPNSRLTWGIRTIFSYVGVVLIGIFFTAIFTALTAIFEPKVNKLIEILKNKSKAIDSQLQKDYQMNEDQAIKYLEEKEFKGLEFIHQLKKLTR